MTSLTLAGMSRKELIMGGDQKEMLRKQRDEEDMGGEEKEIRRK